MDSHGLPSRRALLALAIAVLSGTALVQWYGPNIPICTYEQNRMVVLLLLPAAFSAGLFWLVTEVLVWVVKRNAAGSKAATPLILSSVVLLALGLSAFWAFPSAHRTGVATTAVLRIFLWPTALLLQEVDWAARCTPH